MREEYLSRTDTSNFIGQGLSMKDSGTIASLMGMVRTTILMKDISKEHLSMAFLTAMDDSSTQMEIIMKDRLNWAEAMDKDITTQGRSFITGSLKIISCMDKEKKKERTTTLRDLMSSERKRKAF